MNMPDKRKQELVDNILKFNEGGYVSTICLSTLDDDKEFAKALMEYYNSFKTFPTFLLETLANEYLYEESYELRNIDSSKRSFIYWTNLSIEHYEHFERCRVIFKVFDKFFKFDYLYDPISNDPKRVEKDTFEEVFYKPIKVNAILDKYGKFLTFDNDTLEIMKGQ